MSIKHNLVSGLLLLYGSMAVGHEGHGHSGLPAAPHGGKVKEAVGDANKKGGHADLYCEFTHTNKVLKVYPLTLADDSFDSLSPKEQLSNVEVKVEYPRSKKTETLTVSIGDEAIEGQLVPKEPNRYLVHVSALFGKKSRRCKFQFEGK